MEHVANPEVRLAVQAQVIGRERRLALPIGDPLEFAAASRRAAALPERFRTGVFGGKRREEIVPTVLPDQRLRQAEGEVEPEGTCGLLADEVPERRQAPVPAPGGARQRIRAVTRLDPQRVPLSRAAGDPYPPAGVLRTAEIDAVDPISEVL